jgi:hypothetical protein
VDALAVVTAVLAAIVIGLVVTAIRAVIGSCLHQS